MSEEKNKTQKYLLLNVPARQSKSYYDYITANVESKSLVFVDALFGGLDVAARLTANSDNMVEALEKEVCNLVEKKELTKESAILSVRPFFEKTASGVQENFIIVFIEADEDMRDPSHQNAFVSYMDRLGVSDKIRFAATVESSRPINDLPIPEIVETYNGLFSSGHVVVLEISLTSLDDPRTVVMRKIQNFPDVVSTRTFFAVNFAGEDELSKENNERHLLNTVKDWASPLLNIRRLLGG